MSRVRKDDFITSLCNVSNQKLQFNETENLKNYNFKKKNIEKNKFSKKQNA